MTMSCKFIIGNIFVLLFLFQHVITNNTCMKLSDTGEIGKKLPNSSFMMLFDIGIHSCFKECEAYAMCLSINFNPTMFMCELNSQKKNESLALDNDSSFIYKEIPGVLDYTSKKCGTLSCNHYSKCVHTNSKKFLCIAVGCADPVPELANGSVSIQTFSPPSVTFECNPGYTGVGTKNSISCPPDGKWSSLSYRCEPPERIAFHAVAYSSTSVADIIFDHVLTNIGGGYDNATGVFTVPTAGLYVFSWTIETHGQLTEGALLVNGMQKRLSKAHESSSYYDTTTSFAVLNLTANDKVSVRVNTGRAEARHTMFSGWKINKTGADGTAFNALLSYDHKLHTDTYMYMYDRHIVYDNETLDTDNAYSTSTGNFVAPRSGLYVFMMSAVNFGNDYCNCKFYFSNGYHQPYVIVDSQSGYYDSSSYMTFAWLNAGEYVYVYVYTGYIHTIMRKDSVFAGWQLADDMSVSKSTYPAFLASLSSDYSGSPVVFGTTHSGYHHGYSTSTGRFTADRDGVYVFLYNIEAESELVRTTLTVNGVDKFELRSDGRRTGYDDTSAVAVLQLSSGDQIFVACKYGTVNYYGSNFFGVLLFEM